VVLFGKEMGRKQDIPPEIEEELVDHILLFEVKRIWSYGYVKLRL
jgi:hypothetical protein